MKKRLIGIFITFALILTLAPLIPAYADTAGQLDHVLVSPTVAEVAIGGTVQFTAQALDSNNVTIPGLTYAWNIVSGGGSINGTGFFTAGNITGLFPETVQVIVTQNSTIKTAYASVTVTAAPIVKSKLPLGWSHGEKNGWDGNTPPGWSQGEKKGWDNGMPPGLAKEKNEPQSKNKKNK